MRVAVTGSTGFVGRALLRGLLAVGHEPVRVVRSAAPDSIDSLRWDPAAGRLDPADLAGIDAVVHLAGESIGRRRWSEAQKQLIRDSRTGSTALLAETMVGAESGPGVLISASAVGFYGSRGDEVLDETSTGGDDFLASVCRDWEAAADPGPGRGDQGGASPHRRGPRPLGGPRWATCCRCSAWVWAGGSATGASG